MKDIIAKYKKHTFFQNSAIIVTSLAIALGINMYVLDGNIGKYLKSSVVDIHGVEQTADIYGRVSEDRSRIILWVQRPTYATKSLSLSLVYDTENVSIDSMASVSPGTTLSSISNEPGITTLLLEFSSPTDISGETDLVELTVSKDPSITGNLNIINANFTDQSGETYLFSTSGILF